MRAAMSRRTFLRALGGAAGAVVLGRYKGFSQQTMTIGVLGSASSPLGQGILNGAQLAASELNFKLLPGDLGSETDPALARSVLSNLISQGAEAVVGLSRSDTIPALLLDIPRVRRPFIITGTPLLGTDQVAGNFENFKYIFRAGIVNAAAQAFDGGEFSREFIVGHLIKERKVLRSNAVALVGDPSKQSTDFRAALLPKLTRAGLDVVGNLADSKAGVLLERLQKINVPTAITAFFDTQVGTEFAQGWSANKVKVALFGWNEALLHDDLKGAAIGYVLTDFVAETAKVSPTLEFYKKYQGQFKARPVFTAATTYDAVYALAGALKRARTTEADALVKALEETKMTGVVGLIRFYTVEEQQRDPLKLAVAHDQVYGINKTASAFDGVRPFYTQLAPNGQRVVLYPAEYATGSYVLPPHLG